jgi:hypothetical protein
MLTNKRITTQTTHANVQALAREQQHETARITSASADERRYYSTKCTY